MGRLCPKDCVPYHTANRPPVSNQRLPEILDGRHLPGGLRRDTGRRHPTGSGGDWGWGCRGEKAHAPDWSGRKLRLGPRRGEGMPHPGRVRLSSSWLPRAARTGKAQNAGAASCSVLLWNTRGLEPRSTRHAPYRTAGSLRSINRESSASPSLQCDETSNLNKRAPPPACVSA